MSRVVVVIPLEPRAAGRVASLVRQGPVFDPETAGLERHHVFVTEHEAVFLLEGERGAIERLARDEGVWSAWAEHAPARPRVAEDVYDWIRPEPHENVVYTSTPGPGDSEGGDVYAP
jgi:hypothetical protein